MSEIFASNVDNGEPGIGLMRMFYDMIGVLRSISAPNIFVVFIKITYEKVQKLIELEGMKYLHDENFMNALLSFYYMMCKNSLDKL